MYVMDPKGPHTEASVDEISVVVGGPPVELTEDQLARLADTGVKMVPADADAIEDASLDALRSMAAARGLPVSGTKSELMDRIQEHDDEGDD